MMDKREENFYEIATEEIIQNRPVTSIFGKAYSDAMGDKKKVKSLYIKYRVEQLKKECIEQAKKEAKARGGQKTEETTDSSENSITKLFSKTFCQLLAFLCLIGLVIQIIYLFFGPGTSLEVYRSIIIIVIFIIVIWLCSTFLQKLDH